MAVRHYHAGIQRVGGFASLHSPCICPVCPCPRVDHLKLRTSPIESPWRGSCRLCFGVSPASRRGYRLPKQTGGFGGRFLRPDLPRVEDRVREKSVRWAEFCNLSGKDYHGAKAGRDSCREAWPAPQMATSGQVYRAFDQSLTARPSRSFLRCFSS